VSWLRSAAVAAALVAALPLGRSADVWLADGALRAAFDSETGALVRLERPATGWAIENRPSLGVSFRLHAPLPQQRDNFVFGWRQRAAEVDPLSDHEVRIVWRNLLSEHGGVLPMTFTARVTLERGALTFSGQLRNDSPLTVETLEYPYLGDLASPAPNEPLYRRHMYYANLERHEIYPHFENQQGYWGVDYPTQGAGSNNSLFCLIQAKDQGLYVEMADPRSPYFLGYTFEQHPGVEESMDYTVPPGPSIGGKPVHLEFRATHFIFAAPHSTFVLAPVVLQGYSGDWHAGVDLYKAWRATWFKPAHLPAWARQVHSWQQLQVNSPEEEWRVPYRDLHTYAEACAANGVSAIQLVGWQRGGQDRGNPYLGIDPHLGTWQDLHQAIAASQALGVKIILFGKFVWADITTDWYKEELYKYAIKDPYGDPYQYPGYSYHTPTQLAGINTRRFVMLCPLDAEWRTLATHEFQKLLDLGAAGWLYDEVLGHGPALYCFAPDHGHRVPEYVYAGDQPMSDALHRAANRVNPDFLFAGEAPEDVMLQNYPFSYFRITPGRTPVCSYIDDQTPLMVAVIGFDDREMLNQILKDRYIISYEPYNFKGRLSDFPLTVAYGRKIDALRRRYHDYLWDAPFRDTLGAEVSANGQMQYSVFRRSDGKRAVVVISLERHRPIIARVSLPGPVGTEVAVSPEKPAPAATDGTLQIPARSAAVLLER
jgi:hypothetical protein